VIVSVYSGRHGPLVLRDLRACPPRAGRLRRAFCGRAAARCWHRSSGAIADPVVSARTRGAELGE